jgi:hypothetical protein
MSILTSTSSQLRWVPEDLLVPGQKPNPLVKAARFGHLAMFDDVSGLHIAFHAPTGVKLYAFSSAESGRKFCERAVSLTDWETAHPPFHFGELGQRLSRLYLECRIPDEPVLEVIK